MLKKIKLDPQEFPIKQGESWHLVHPNNANCEFYAPPGAVTVCTTDFMSFMNGVAYEVLSSDRHNGWITIANSYERVEMPYYVFARYFDAEAFVRGVLRPDDDLEKAVPFNYRPTVPFKSKEDTWDDNE